MQFLPSILEIDYLPYLKVIMSKFFKNMLAVGLRMVNWSH